MILSEIVSLSFEVEGAKVQIFMHVLKISSVKGVRQKLLRAGAHHQRSTTVYTPNLQHLPMSLHSLHVQTCQVSRISRETHAFSISLMLSLRTVEISCIFLLNEKQYF